MVEKRHVAELARAIRYQLEWQTKLGASGAPPPDRQELERLRSSIREARLRSALTPKAAPSPTAKPSARAKDGRALPTQAPHARARPAAQDPYQTLGLMGGQRAQTQEAEPPVQEVPRTSKGSTAEARARLKRVKQDLGDCQRCPLGSTRRHLVFGVGDPLADLVFVGEAPGWKEDQRGEPFVGPAGQLLTKMIGAMGLARSDVYILNVVKCRPPGNRDPEPDELAACEPFLQSQLDALRPRVIVTLGRYAAQALLRESIGITKLRGKWRTYHDIKLMPTFHPAYVLRKPQARRPVWEDLQLVMEELRGGR